MELKLIFFVLIFYTVHVKTQGNPRCNGGTEERMEECCDEDEPCGEGQGDCDDDDDNCLPGLKCVEDSCGSQFYSGADCCMGCNGGTKSQMKKCCDDDEPCGEGQGDCDDDDDNCAPGLKCIEDSCGSAFYRGADCCFKEDSGEGSGTQGHSATPWLYPNIPGDTHQPGASNDRVVTSAVYAKTRMDTISQIWNTPKGKKPRDNTAEGEHNRNQRINNQALFFAGQFALSATLTASRLRNQSGHPTSINSGYFENADIANTFLRDQCPPTPVCDRNAKFRTSDGSCNNLRQVKYGMMGTPLQRLLPNAYQDGLMQPKLAKSGRMLPGARVVTNSAITRQDAPSSDITTMFVAFGQYLDHDMSHVPNHQDPNGERIECCGWTANEIEQLSPMCFPIEIPQNDPVSWGRSCMTFVRSVPGPNLQCAPGPLNQMNQITHWLDNSHDYGSDKVTLRLLRSFRNGIMKTGLAADGAEILPDDTSEECREGSTCMMSGDLRNNEQPTLGALHTLFVREHNRISRILEQLNPIWSDELLYQNSKRIVNAQWQHIIYNEFLPVLLGEQQLDKFSLRTLKSGFSNSYRNDFNPSVTNVFTAAAFRFGHSMIQGLIRTIAIVGRENNFNLTDAFADGNFLRKAGMIDNIFRGISQQPAQKVDNNVIPELLDELFAEGSMGLDLIALNIQRGRDHGLPGYVHYRSLCQGNACVGNACAGNAINFNQLSSNISPEKIQLLRQTYADVEDIDAHIGMLMETPTQGSLLGETLSCIIGDTFSRLREGDRFFYDLSGQTGSFTLNQLNEIRKTSLARLICDNARGINEIQPLVFKIPDGYSNQITGCNTHQYVDLNVFKE